MIRVFFYGYNFKAQILQVIFCFAYLEIVVQHFIYEDERSLFQLIASCFGLLAVLVAFCILYQLMITWIGFKFLGAMMPQESQEQLLNSLQEGVFIVDEETNLHICV